MEVEDLVTISDDDDEPSQVNKTVARLKKSSKSKSTSSSTSSSTTCTETASQCTSATDDCIVVDSESSQKDENSNFAKLFEKKIQNEEINLAVIEIRKKNEHLATFAEACLCMENNQGMLRIISRTLMRAYNQADKTYIESNNFQRVINKAIGCLKRNPNKKFSCVKNLCDTLSDKRNEYYFTENNTTILGKRNGTSKYNGRIKRCKLDSIVIDSDEDSDVIIGDVIDLDDVVLLEAQNSQKSASISSHSDDEKENIICDEILAESDGKLDVNDGNLVENDGNVAKIDKDLAANHVNLAENLANDENSVEMLLTPNFEEVVPLNLSPCKRPIEDLNSSQGSEELDDLPQYTEEVTTKIEILEKQILHQKMLIKQLDEQEVDLDMDYSPYIMCEKAKETIVKLYQQLCALTGTPPVKKKRVSLQVLEGHPPGPTRKLEEFINNNIGNDGLPPFPDFCDVVQCVLEVSAEDGLGWKKAQVLKEASALFTQCGGALQKRRMQREYRDLITLVKAEQLGSDDDDPANKDLELLRKLEENRRIASRKEKELLDRFTMMQYLPTEPKPLRGPSCEPYQNGIVQISTTSSHININHNNLTENQRKRGTSENHRRIQPILHVDANRNGLIKTEISNHHIPERQVECNKTRNGRLVPNPFAQVRVNINKERDQNFESVNNKQISTDTSKTVKLDLNNAIVLIDQTDSAGHSVEQNKYLGHSIEQNKNADLMEQNNVTDLLEQNKVTDLMEQNNVTDLMEQNNVTDLMEQNNVTDLMEQNNVTDLMEHLESDSSDDEKSDVDSGNDSHSDNDETDIIKLVNTDDVTNHKSLTVVNNNNKSKEIVDKESSNTDLNPETNNNISVNTTNISNTANTSLDTTNISNITNESGINSDVNQSVVKVKKERVDIYHMLEELGEDFTSTVIEIEDPFLVIDILSDSEDEENQEST